VLAAAFAAVDVLALLTMPPDPLPEALAAVAAVVLLALTLYYLRHNRATGQP
jgi:Sec-independent protein secretion pathway component TatC